MLITTYYIQYSHFGGREPSCDRSNNFVCLISFVNKIGDFKYARSPEDNRHYVFMLMNNHAYCVHFVEQLLKI